MRICGEVPEMAIESVYFESMWAHRLTKTVLFNSPDLGVCPSSVAQESESVEENS